MTKPINIILAPKPEARPRIYAYSINDKAHKGLLKVGQTTRDVKQRVTEQVKTAGIKTVVIPKDNEPDLEEIPEDVRQDLEFVLAEVVDDVLNATLHPEVVEEKSRLASVG